MTLTQRHELVRFVPDHGTFIELGVAAGRFAVQILQSHGTVNYIGVDRWQDHHDEAEMQQAQERLDRYHLRGPVLMRRTFEAAAREAPMHCADVVYVDGYAHTGQDQGRTLADWWPKVKPGGVMAGHDYCPRYLPTMQAVDAFAAGLGLTVNVIDDKPFPSWYVEKPHTYALLDPAASICLVGNGPSVLRQPLGPIVDQHEEVIRFNAYQTASFEAHVGTRTTIWSTFGHDVLPGTDSTPPEKVLFVHGDRGQPALTHLPLFRLPMSFFNAVQARVQAFSEWPADQVADIIPSSGLLVALWCVEMLGVPKLHFLGMDHFSKELTSQHHYWHPGPFTIPKEHDGAAEARVLSAHAQSGRLVPLGMDNRP